VERFNRHDARRVGLPAALRVQRGTHRRPGPIAAPVQPSPCPHRARRPPTPHPHQQPPRDTTASAAIT
jgi:hypothetical protein